MITTSRKPTSRARHLHRKGLGDQRGDRPAAPGRHQFALQPPRCGDRRLGVLHLRPGQPAGLRPSGAESARGRDGAAQQLLRHLVDIHYERNDNTCARHASGCAAMCWRFSPPTARPPIASASGATRSSASARSTPLTGELLADHQSIDIFPAKHFVTSQERLEEAHRRDRARAGGTGGALR
jgi:hypothetical protein